MSRVDIHMVTWQRPEITRLAIETINRNTRPKNFRLVVFDNGSDLQMTEMLRKLHLRGRIDELHLEPENIGLEKARNFMLHNSTKSEYIICADNDCLPPPFDFELGKDWVERLVDLMKANHTYAAIACRTQVMVGSGNIFEDEEADITDFPHPGGSLRIMRADMVKYVGGWEGKPGRGAEERYICGKLKEAGWDTGFATHINTLHLFGVREHGTDRWGYEEDWSPEMSGHSDVSHPALIGGDDFKEVEEYSGTELAKEYFRC
jgi:glycosyltransferase involved in cell wall biosynthesis